MGFLASGAAAEIKCFLPRSVVYFLASNRTYVYICDSVRYIYDTYTCLALTLLSYMQFCTVYIWHIYSLRFAAIFTYTIQYNLYLVHIYDSVCYICSPYMTHIWTSPSSCLHIYNSIQSIYGIYRSALASFPYIQFSTIYI